MFTPEKMDQFHAVVLSKDTDAVIEAVLRRRLTTLLLRVTLLLAGIGAIVLAVTYATEVLVVALVGLAAIILLDNVRELRGT